MKLLENVDINVDIELRDIENFLRDNITFILKNKYNEEWEDKLGVSPERIVRWKERREEEKKRLGGKELEGRLLYYSDFYDLQVIIKKNWDIFKEVFPEKKLVEYQLKQLESFRNPNAHNRDLLEHQKYLLKGIAGEIKSHIIKYRGEVENIDTYFPKIDRINVNGKIYSCSSVELDVNLRRGDELDIILYASTPPNQKVYYAISAQNLEWQESPRFHIQIDETDYIGENTIIFLIKSDQEYHRDRFMTPHDDICIIKFMILPDK